jgi:putative spermidine/putrescine transport system substrate-binding protein
MRRTLVGRVAPALALVAVATLVVACGGSDAPSESASAEKSGGAMTLTTWGGAYQIGQTKAFATPFGDESGAKVTVTSPTDYAKLKSMVKTGNVVWDVVDVEPFITRQGCEEGWLEKVDQTNIPQDAFLASMKPSPCGVPNGAYTTMIAFQPDKFTGAEPQNWADFFDTKRFPGKRAIQNYAAPGPLEAALLADGVSKEELYPLDVDRAFRKLSTIRKDLVFYGSGDQSEQLMRSGEVVMCACWASRMFDLESQGVDVGRTWNQQVIGYDDFVIPKGAKNATTATEFIKFAVSPESQVRMTEFVPWGPSTTEAAAKPADATKEWVPTTPERLKVAISTDYDWWTENFDDVASAYQQWLLK